MTPELIQVAEQRNVQRLESVGTTLALGKLSSQELVDLAGNLYDRRLNPEFPHQEPQLQRDFMKVAGELGRRA